MDEVELTRRAYGELPEDPEARARARVRLRAAMLDSVEGSPPVPRRRQHRRLPVLAALVAMLALAGTLLLPVQPSVAAELQRLRQTIAAGPVTELDPATSLEVDIVASLSVTSTDLVSGEAYTLIVGSRETFVLGEDGTGDVTEIIDSVSFANPDDEAAWRAAGAPTLPKPGDVERQQIGPGEAVFYDPGALSSDPERLLEALRSGAVAPLPPGDDQVFWLIGHLLGHVPLELPQRLTLIEVIGALEGVSSLGGVTDPIGRAGEGFAVDAAGGRTVLIFDPSTGRLLASELHPSSPMPSSWIAYLSVRVVPSASGA